MAAEHVLKTAAEPFAAVLDGRKTFEWRRDDRTPPFAVGDHLRLVEDPPTGRSLVAVVTYVLRDAFDVPPGWAVLSLTGARLRVDQLAEDRKLLARLLAIEDGLTEWEVSFIDSLAQRLEGGRPLIAGQRERALQIDEGT